MNVGNVLSLCNGISVGQLALQKAGIEYGYYVASETDKYAIKATQHNFPATIQAGDITKFDVTKLPFKIDLVLSGTPCTSFSIAGKLKEFSADSGQLFFQFCRILNQVRKINPDVKYLFENVASMRKEVRDVITCMLGEPIKINSALVCAQNRNRLYFTNIEGIQQPQDRGIVLQDILETDVDTKYHLSETILRRINKDAVLKQLMILKLQREKAYAITGGTCRQDATDFLVRNKGSLEQVNPKVVANINKSQDGKDFAISGKSQCLSAGHGNMPKVALAGTHKLAEANKGSQDCRVYSETGKSPKLGTCIVPSVATKGDRINVVGVVNSNGCIYLVRF